MKIATKLTKRVAEFVNENKCGLKYNIYQPQNCLFHYPEYKNSGHNYQETMPGYTHVSEQEFIDMVTAELKPKEMKTKCIVLGQENEPVKQFKKIELLHVINSNLSVSNWIIGTKVFKELIFDPRDEKYNGLDIIKGIGSDGVAILLLGHWNDGVV